jgi:hypothetical protein
MKVIAFKVEINGVETAIKNEQELADAVKLVNTAYKNADYGTANRKELEKSLGTLKKLQSDGRAEVRNAGREYEIAADKGKQSYRGLNAELVNLRAQYRNLDKAQRDTFGPDLAKRIGVIDKELKQIDADLGLYFRNVGNYAGGIKEAFASLGGLDLDQFATLPGALIAGGALLFETAGYVNTLTDRFRILRGEVELLSGATGEQLSDFTVKVAAIAKTFSVETKEINQAANAVSKQLGIDFGDALDRIESGFIRGSDTSFEFLDGLREYPAFFKEAFRTPEEAADALFNTLNRGATEGLYSDKGVDTVKEVTLRLREMTKATQEGLAGIGLDSKELQKQIEEEGIGAAISTVSERLGTFSADSKEAGEALADIFGGAGEDAGFAFASSLAGISKKVVVLEEDLTDYQRAQLRALELNKEFARVQEELAQEFTGTQVAVGNLTTEIQTVLLKAFLEVTKTVATFVGLIRAIPAFAKENRVELGLLAGGLLTLNSGLVVSAASILAVNIQQTVLAVRTAALTVATAAYTFVQRGLNLVLRANPIGLVITAIALLALGFKKAYAESETFRAFLSGLKAVAKEVFTVIGEAVTSFVAGFNSIKDGNILEGLKQIGVGLVKSNPIGIAVTQGKRLGDAFNKGYATEIGKRKVVDSGLEVLLPEPTAKVELETKKAIDSLFLLRKELEKLKFQRENVDVNSEAFKTLSKQISDTEQKIKSFEGAAKDSAVAVDAFAEDSIKGLQKGVADLRSEFDNASVGSQPGILQKLLKAEEALKELEDYRKQLRKTLTKPEEAISPLLSNAPNSSLSATTTSVQSERSLKLELERIEKLKFGRIEAAREAFGQDERFIAARKILEDRAARDTAQSRLDLDDLNAIERLELEQEVADRTVSINEEKNDRLLQLERNRSEQLAEISALIFRSANDGLNALSEGASIRASNEIIELEQRYEREIELAEGNSNRQEELRMELASRRGEIELAEFETQKRYRTAAALASLAEGIVNILATPSTIPEPFTAGFKAVRIGVLATTAAVQIANIQSQQIAERGVLVKQYDVPVDGNMYERTMSGGGVVGHWAVGQTHLGLNRGIDVMLNGLPVKVEHGEFMDVDEYGGRAVINKRSAAINHRDLMAAAGLTFPGKRKWLSTINSQRNYGVSFAAEGTLIKPDVEAVQRMGTRSGGGVISVGIDDESVALIASATAAAVRVGAYSGVQNGLSDVNRRLERENILNERTNAND